MYDTQHDTLIATAVPIRSFGNRVDFFLCMISWIALIGTAVSVVHTVVLHCCTETHFFSLIPCAFPSQRARSLALLYRNVPGIF